MQYVTSKYGPVIDVISNYSDLVDIIFKHDSLLSLYLQQMPIDLLLSSL